MAMMLINGCTNPLVAVLQSVSYLRKTLAKHDIFSGEEKMKKFIWCLTSALAFGASPALAQPETIADAVHVIDPGEIIVTATRRSVNLSAVPLAISAISGENLARAGVSDIRQLNQLSPSLFVSSSTSEAVGGVARIRGVGTVGDNPGLESSVATFVDGVYRSRSGVAFTELGAIERIEVLRGPQGTLFGRNASAGLINVLTAAPRKNAAYSAELSYGNYNAWRGQLSATGPISETIAYRFDGVYAKRDGFLTESNDYAGASDRDFNNRDRYLVRGQLALDPTDAIHVRLIADYAKRKEDCCGATFLPVKDVQRAGDGSITQLASSFAALERTLGAVINDNTYARRVSVTPGRDYHSDVKDWGLSAELDWELGGAKLTSITAWRDWTSERGQDADFTNLDLIYRSAFDQRFRTFTQEFRLQGKVFGDRLDWLVGGYFGNETLNLNDNLRFGRDYGLLQGCRIATVINAAARQPGAAGCINPLARPLVAAGLGGLATPLLAGLDRLAAIGDSGASQDVFRQRSRTWALFTHDEFKISDMISLTLGARYTDDHKALTGTVASNTTICSQQRAALGAIAANPNFPASARALATNLVGLSCASNIGGGVDGNYSDSVSDEEWTGTAILSIKPTDRLLGYASFSKGYKAGGFNIDRAGLMQGTPLAVQLRFEPEKVNAFELGAKYRGRGFRLAGGIFYEKFSNFQLNTFNGVNFIVENIQGCGALAGGAAADSDLDATTGACTGKSQAGVTSQGFELEAALYPADTLSLDFGYTYARTEYADDLSGIGGRALSTSLFQLPGAEISNAPRHVVTGSGTWMPVLGSLTGLIHADFRYQAEINTGSDLLPEKAQEGVMLVNARIGISGNDARWAIEFWAQNLFNVDYAQVVTGAPLQGSGSIANALAGVATRQDGLFVGFPAEPRTYGLTLRTKF